MQSLQHEPSSNNPSRQQTGPHSNTNKTNNNDSDIDTSNSSKSLLLNQLIDDSSSVFDDATNLSNNNKLNRPKTTTMPNICHPMTQQNNVDISNKPQVESNEIIPDQSSSNKYKQQHSAIKRHIHRGTFKPFVILLFLMQLFSLLYELQFHSSIFDPILTLVVQNFPEIYASNAHQNDYLSAINGQTLIKGVSAFDELERVKLRSEAKTMFYHAYHSYINTYPADEILPISCQGRFRQFEDSSDIDDSIGNFSLTLVDSLDTLVMMGDLDEFDVAIKRIIGDLNFDMDIVVSVFETNIRMLGGLLSAHILAKSIQNQADRSVRYFNSSSRHKLDWYNSELLDLAEDLGRRLLPAFETRTGIPHPRVNLKYGMDSNELRSVQETCTACAGSLILEFGTLSRLTGDSIFEEKARQALDSLWEHRHRSTDLVGTVLNVDSGEWVRRESGVGAGSDSYYEYLMKAYILLGDPTYLHRFNRHYSSVMRYISRGPFLIDVHMHRPNRVAKGFMDALSAFWPGLQVLKGDLRAAISTHAMFNEVIRRHSYLPEAFTTDLQVYWANHQMRPEFLESTYFLHRATQKDYYLEIGKGILKKLQDLKVDCGFAGLKDVRTGVHDDRMSSFVLAETLKYLYLLFSNDNETHVDLEKFIFSTEGHLLPISLGLVASSQKTKQSINEESAKHVKTRTTTSKNGPSSDKKSEIEERIVTKAGKESIHEDSENNKGEKEYYTSKMNLKRSDEPSPAAVARLLIKVSDKFNQDRSVISLGEYENSCPSLEAQEMRFDSSYHPFLNKRIGSPVSLDIAELFEAQRSHMRLMEKVREFTMNDPDYLKLASSWGLSLTVQPNGIVKLLLDADQAQESDKTTTNTVQQSEDGVSQCMI